MLNFKQIDTVFDINAIDVYTATDYLYKHGSIARTYIYKCAKCRKDSTTTKEYLQSVMMTAGESPNRFLVDLGTSFANVREAICPVLQKQLDAGIVFVDKGKSCPSCGAPWKIALPYGNSVVLTHAKFTFVNGDGSLSKVFAKSTLHVTARAGKALPYYVREEYKEWDGRGQIRIAGKNVYNRQTVWSVLNTLRQIHGADNIPTLDKYYSSRNHRLEDILNFSPMLSATDVLNLESNLRKRIYYAYDKHGTKAAFQALLGGKGNKKLDAFTWANIGYVDSIRELLNVFDRDQVVVALSLLNNSADSLQNLALLLPLGYTFKRLMNLAGLGGLHFAYDINRMYKELKGLRPAYILPKVRNILDLHDALTRDYNREFSNSAKVIKLPTTDLEMVDGMRIADTAADLLAVGNSMSICVGSYRQVVLSGQYIIAYLEQDSLPVACIQVDVKDRCIVQAKLKFNQRVAENPDIEKIVVDWATSNGLGITTYDMLTKLKATRKKIQLEYRGIEDDATDTKGPLPIPVLEEDIPW